MFIIAVDVSGNALSDTPPSSVNAVAGNEIQEELMLMQPRSVRVAKFKKGLSGLPMRSEICLHGKISR